MANTSYAIIKHKVNNVKVKFEKTMKKIGKILIFILIINVISVVHLYPAAYEAKGFVLGILPFLLARTSYDKNSSNSQSDMWAKFSTGFILSGIATLVVVLNSTNDERDKVIGGWAAGGLMGYITIFQLKW